MRRNPNDPPKPGPGRPKGCKNKLTRERVEQELRHLAFSDPLAMFEKAHGKRRVFTLKEISDMAPEVRRCIASIKVRTENLSAGDNQQDQTVEVKLWDKVKALELCGRALGMFKDKVELTVPEELIGRLDRAKQRAREAQK